MTSGSWTVPPRRKASVLLAEGHRSAGEHRAHAEAADGLDLDVDRVVHARREEVVVVGGSRAAGFEEFGQGDGGRELEGLRSQTRPHGVEVRQPAEEREVGDGSPRAGERLIEVVMGVDEPRGDDVIADVDDLVEGSGGAAARCPIVHGPTAHRLAAGRHELDDRPGLSVDDDPTVGGRVSTAAEVDGPGIARPDS